MPAKTKQLDARVKLLEKMLPPTPVCVKCARLLRLKDDVPKWSPGPTSCSMCALTTYKIRWPYKNLYAAALDCYRATRMDRAKTKPAGDGP